MSSVEDRNAYYRERYRGERHEHHKAVRLAYYRRNREAINAKRKIYRRENIAAIKVSQYWNVSMAEARRMLEQGDFGGMTQQELDRRDGNILAAYFTGKSLKQIGRDHDISAKRVWAIIGRELRRAQYHHGVVLK